MSVILPPKVEFRDYSVEEIKKRWSYFPCFYEIIPNAKFDNPRRLISIGGFLRQFIGNSLPATIKRVEDNEQDLADLHAKLNNQGAPRPRVIKYKDIQVVSGKDLLDFEKEYFPDSYREKESNKNIPEEMSYSTPWLKIMNLAISEFFNPRWEVDANRDTVRDWICNEAKKEGINEPKSIAMSIFTIIKPVDHKPIKRKTTKKKG